MPMVSDEFVKNAKALAEGVPALQAKLAEAEAGETDEEKQEKKAQAQEGIKSLAEATVDTLVAQGLIPANEKTAAMEKLMDHSETIQALNKTAQMVQAPSMGAPEKTASNNVHAVVGTRGDEPRESDKHLLSKLGFHVG